MAVVGVLLFAGCGGKKEPLKQAGGQPPTVVDVMIVQTSQISSELEVNGEVAANEFVELHPEVSGRLTYLNVPEGGNVAQGTVIARINDADLQAQVTKTKVQLDLAKQTEARLKKLLDVNGVNQADYDIAVGQVNSLEADLNYSAALIEKTVVKAPFSGTLGLRQVSPGAYVTPATTLATLQQVQQLKVDFNVPEEFSSYIQKGDTVFIRTDLDQETRQTATVWAIEPQANRDTRNLKARAILAGDKANPGAFVKVYIARKGNAKSIMI
ncbi:MAG: efflux RND transporter periplasmic adaptor subunit, partial [Bacteroidia bacterium]|nr:efflux RND transporter periplasmic adaptor subunit [Bacteroidia bacterium]